MSKRRKFACDFETTVFEGQEKTEVWAAAFSELYTDNTSVYNNINDFFNSLIEEEQNLDLYFHNLKFDGEFIVSWLFNQKYKNAIETPSIEDVNTHYYPTKDNLLLNKSFTVTISDSGLWYAIKIKTEYGHIINIYDSLKLLPFSLDEIGKSFNTQHQKLSIEYIGYREAYNRITEVEYEYISNDVLVLKEALEIFFNKGYNKLTIGSCCLSEYKNLYELVTTNKFEDTFIDLSSIKLSSNIFGCNNIDAFVRKTYKGGWCLVKEGEEKKIIKNGLTADVNSLYSSVMHSLSGNVYPVGKPIIWTGDYIPVEAKKPNKYFFIQLKTRFKLKKDMLPTIQIKGDIKYPSNKWLTTSDIYNKNTGSYTSFYYDDFGKRQEAIPLLTLTMSDYELLNKHYDLFDTKIIGGCYFNALSGIFDEYIDKYMSIKITSKGAERQLAKLFLNNLYGKFSVKNDNSFKVPILNEESGIVEYYTVHNYDRKLINIAVGSAVTSYARYFTITHAQDNYKHFIYADTDSIHCDCTIKDLKNIEIDDRQLLKWKIESEWDFGYFVRQKTYIEHIKNDNGNYYNIKCAGLPERCKNLLIMSLEGYNKESKINENYNFNIDDIKKLNEREKKFITEKRKVTDFDIGICIPSKLKPHRIKGGVVLVEEDYVMRKNIWVI